MHDDVKGYVPVSLFPPSSKLIFFTSWIVSDQFERNETSFLLNNFENNFFLQLENNYFGRTSSRSWRSFWEVEIGGTR